MEKGKLVQKLRELGVPNPALHCGEQRIWVCPYYLSLKQVETLISYCEEQGKKYDDLSTEMMAQFSELAD